MTTLNKVLRLNWQGTLKRPVCMLQLLWHVMNGACAVGAIGQAPKRSDQRLCVDWQPAVPQTVATQQENIAQW